MADKQLAQSKSSPSSKSDGGGGCGSDSANINSKMPSSSGRNVETNDIRNRTALMRQRVKSPKRESFCEIPSCGRGLPSERLTLASSSDLAYFGFKDRLAMVKMCSSCAEKARKAQMLEESVKAIRNSQSIFAVNQAFADKMPELVNLDGEDSPTRDNGELVEVDFDRQDVAGLVKSFMNKFNIGKQMTMCTKHFVEETNKLAQDMQDTEDQMDTISAELYNTCRNYNSVFDKRAQPLIVEEVDISANGTMRRRPVIDHREIFVNTDSLIRLADTDLTPIVKSEDHKTESAADVDDECKEVDGLNDSIVSIPDPCTRKAGPASKTGYYEALECKPVGPFERKVQPPAKLREKRCYDLQPTPKFIPRSPPKLGEIVYAMVKNLLYCWHRGEVLEVVFNAETSQTEYIVHYEPTKNGKPTGGIVGECITRTIKQLTLKQMAYSVPCPFILPVGSRVIAKYRDEVSKDPEKSDGQYFSGIIADPPKAATKMRYLIFFDDGCAQYVFPDDVLLLCEASKLVWNDVYPDSYDFIKQYVIKWPNWPLVRLQLGSMISTEWNGRWLISRVLEIDNCLARVRFEDDGREEWIYRGSARLRPVYRVLEAEQKLKEHQGETNSKPNSIPRHDRNEFKHRNDPPIEYGTQDKTLFQIARKSTARQNYYNELELFSSNGMPGNLIDKLNPQLCIEYQGTIKPIKIPNDVHKPRAFVRHNCDPNCVIKFVPSKEHRKFSPLAMPLLFGWEREVSQTTGRGVVYRSPCGVVLKDYEELTIYLDITCSNLSIDHFCFEYAVDCLHGFVPSRALRNIEDISYGKEGAQVECINSADHEEMPYLEYTAERIAGPDVNLNTDEEFLVCCDCTDNCQDKAKCSCWKLTYEGIAFTKLNDPANPTVGYEHKRLKDHVVSGIFECNNRCKCKQTCTNRVVQKGTLQWPLQIFKTANKGWGIRAVYDMPEGAFICTYAGQILTDNTANQEGIEFGDEYLAELDYIECNEAVKADYESDVTDIEAEDLEEKEKRKKKTDADGSDDEPNEQWSSSLSTKKTKNGQTRKFATRRTTGQKRNLAAEKVINDDDDIITARNTDSNSQNTLSKRKRKRMNTRALYGEHEMCYIMDAKSKGNLGRYLNHSCSPNVFVQNVFFDTHDLRFPMVAFFTNTHVKAGTELTWDYHYQIGSVPGKMLYCYCMTPYCRGRLL